jgi:hypothetical protein
MVGKCSVWVAVARRQLWFKDLVEARLGDVIDLDAIVRTSDPTVLRSIIKLTDRIERHYARMQRHADRASNQGRGWRSSAD